jgi:hypothetical protein
MADLLEHDPAIDEQEGHMDAGAKVLLAEVEGIIADRLGQGGAPRGAWRSRPDEIRVLGPSANCGSARA